MKIPERLAIRFVLQGRVQGVGCRAQVEKRVNALALDQAEAVAGWVRNLPSGEVEVVLEASLAFIEQVERLLASGLRLPVEVKRVLVDRSQNIEMKEKIGDRFRALR